MRQHSHPLFFNLTSIFPQFPPRPCVAWENDPQKNSLFQPIVRSCRTRRQVTAQALHEPEKAPDPRRKHHTGLDHRCPGSCICQKGLTFSQPFFKDRRQLARQLGIRL